MQSRTSSFAESIANPGAGVMFVKVDYPGYWLDGEVLEGRRTFLYTKSNIALDVYLVKDPDTGEEFGIPINRVVVMRDPPVIDLRGKLRTHAGAGMFAEVG